MSGGDVLCQACGEAVCADAWNRHRAEHVTGARTTIPAVLVFERVMGGVPPSRSGPVLAKPSGRES